MFKDLAMAPQAATLKVKVAAETVVFLNRMTEAGYRLTYAGLAAVDNHITGYESRLSLGQQGAKLAKVLPLELQAYICNVKGRDTFAHGQVPEWATVDTMAKVAAMPVIDPNNAVAAYGRTQA